MSAVVTFSSHYTASMAKKVVTEGMWDAKLILGVYEWITVNIVHVYLNRFTLFFQAFKNQYALRVSVSWFSSFKASQNRLLPPQNLVNVSCRSSVLLPRQTGTLSHSPSFCKAVGGPITPQQPYECSTPSSRASLPSHMMLLNNLCQTAGFGRPQYKISCSRAGPDGYLHFSYQVFILGINMSLEGVVMILPGANISSTMEEAREAVAQQVLRKVFRRQVSHWAGLHSSAISTALLNAVLFHSCSKNMIDRCNFLRLTYLCMVLLVFAVVCSMHAYCLLCCYSFLSKCDFKSKSDVLDSLGL